MVGVVEVVGVGELASVGEPDVVVPVVGEVVLVVGAVLQAELLGADTPISLKARTLWQ